MKSQLSQSTQKDTLLARVGACIGQELVAVDALFTKELRSDFACVSTLIKHVSRFRGKMLRPMLVLLSGQASGKLTQEHIVIATVAEMVHMATLVHDDVLDEAELRRKGATINHLRGNEAAVLLGDYLISHSYHLCASLDSQSASRAIARITNQICEGELLQIDNRNNLDLDEDTYYQIIRHKTAVLCAICCQLGAQYAQADEGTISRLQQFGMALGIAFQIQDDILDIVGQTDIVGKTLGIDIGKGKLTLPMIHFLKTAPQEHQTLLRTLLSGHEPDQSEKIRNLILPSDAIDYARAAASQYANKACDSLSTLPNTPAHQLLCEIAQYAITRTA